MKNDTQYATLAFGIVAGFALGIVVGMFSPPANFKVPTACDGQAFWCWLDRWQTLIAGSIAIVGAAVAWSTVERQLEYRDKEKLYARRKQLVIAFRLLNETRFVANRYKQAFSEIREALESPFDIANELLAKGQKEPIPIPDEVREHFSVLTFVSHDMLNQAVRVYRTKVQAIGIARKWKDFKNLPDDENKQLAKLAGDCSFKSENFSTNLNACLEEVKVELRETGIDPDTIVHRQILVVD